MNKEKALTLKEAAEKLGVSYHTIFSRRHKLGFRLPGSRIWRIWPSQLAEYTRPRNNVFRLSLRADDRSNSSWQSENTRSRASGISTSLRQAEKELDALLELETKEKRKSCTTN